MFLVLFLVSIEKSAVTDNEHLQAEFEDERKLLSKGKIPHNKRDLQNSEEPLDFPIRYGK